MSRTNTLTFTATLVVALISALLFKQQSYQFTQLLSTAATPAPAPAFLLTAAKDLSGALISSILAKINTQQPIIQAQDTNRIDAVYKYVRSHFTESTQLEEIAAEVNMTIPSFCRYFKKVTGKTFTEFVNEFRIVHACKLLSEEQFSISEVCYESGFNNFSHFNRLFKQKTGKNPNAYRKEVEKVVYEDFYVG